MNNTVRYILAGALIFLIIILQPLYFDWLGFDLDGGARVQGVGDDGAHAVPGHTERKKSEITGGQKNDYFDLRSTKESFLTISTPLYTATLSSRSGGSFVDYTVKDENSGELKYVGGYDDDGVFNPDIPVSLILPSKERCMPCLAGYDKDADQYVFLNSSFNLSNPPDSDTLFLFPGETKELTYQMLDQNGRVLIAKSVLFSADTYISVHVFDIKGPVFNSGTIVLQELLWYGGLRPTEEKEDEDVQYGSGIMSQAGTIDDIQINSDDRSIERLDEEGQTEWVAVRTKYFISALIDDDSGDYAVLSAENSSFGNRNHTPVYNAAIGYSLNRSFISSKIYLGPLDVDHVVKVGSGLDATMNWGFSVIRPISRGVLWILKFMHKTLHLNYGLALLIFAILIRLITGPLTKKSFESSQNMQKIQPELKKIQAKYKGDPQGLNRETMALYKKHKVNPLGGCLPILLQMPLLWALFVVFRTTIEFRGAPFFLWINDLSKPDVVFDLPFSIPIYGSGVAILPLIMGSTLMLTMRMSSATMDKSQKPVMYIMNGFFVLLFNTFPSGLNLYYTAYNILSFFQQRSIRGRADKK